MSEADPQDQRSTNTIQGGLGFNIGPLTTATYQDPSEAEHIRRMAAEEAAHLRKKEDDEREHAHKKELAEIERQATAQKLVLGLIIAIALLAGAVILLPGSSPSSVDKAWGGLALILGGFVGYIAGQSTKK